MGGYVESTLRQRRGDYSTDVLREKAKTFITRLGRGRRAVLPLPRLQGAAPAADPGAAPRGPVPEHPAVAAAELQRGRRLRQADLGAERCALAELGAASTRSASTSSRCCRRSTRRSAATRPTASSASWSTCATSASPTTRIVVFFADNGWYWGEHRLRAKNNPYEEAIRSPMFVRYPKLAPLPRTETRFALNIDLAPTFAELAGVGRADRARRREPACACSTARAPTLAHRLPGRGLAGQPPVGARARGAVEVHRDARRSGQSRDPLRDRALRPGGRSLRAHNVAGDPANAARIAAMAARLRQLRPNWPVDSDPNGPDPAEDD